MKRIYLLPLGICLLSSCAMQSARAAHTNADTAKIAQVTSGQAKTAYASWWGFDSTDSTQNLQNAINSRVPVLIIDKIGSDWIVGKTLRLVSNQKIILNDGVVIQAKKGEFHGKNDALFGGSNLQNVTIEGSGKGTGKLRMQRADYDNSDLYTHSEWRHGISLRDCSNITLRNFSITETGGDGLYLGASHEGYNDKVLVENMDFDNNYRQGISIISAQNFTVRNCRFTNTKGTPPEDGIDFEPNHAGQRLINCVVDKSTFINNAGGGVGLYTVKMDKTTRPISIAVTDCQFQGNSYGAGGTASRDPKNSVTGEMTFTNCQFDHDAILLQDTMAKSVHFVFNNCTLDFRKSSKPTSPFGPIIVRTDPRSENVVLGGVTFDNVTVLADKKMEPFQVALVSPTEITDSITGDIYLDLNGTKTKFDLAGYLDYQRDQMKKLAGLKPAKIDISQLHAPAQGGERKDNSQFFARRRFVFLQYAEKGQNITIDAAVTNYDHKQTPLQLLDPKGNVLQTVTPTLDGKPVPITFTAAETGMYQVKRTLNFSQQVDVSSDAPGNGYLVNDDLSFLPIKGQLYFQVPAGVKKFTIGAATPDGADVALVDGHGKEVQRNANIMGIQLFTATRKNASQSEIWSLSVSSVKRGLVVNMYEPLIPVVSTNPHTLLLR